MFDFSVGGGNYNPAPDVTHAAQARIDQSSQRPSQLAGRTAAALAAAKKFMEDDPTVPDPATPERVEGPALNRHRALIWAAISAGGPANGQPANGQPEPDPPPANGQLPSESSAEPVTRPSFHEQMERRRDEIRRERALAAKNAPPPLEGSLNPLRILAEEHDSRVKCYPRLVERYGANEGLILSQVLYLARAKTLN